MNQADPEEAPYLALGQRNAEAIELFERFCGNVRVEIMSGRGMLEAATGLPIAHRAFRCAYASGTVAYSMRLDDAAVEFYEQHCRPRPWRWCMRNHRAIYFLFKRKSPQLSIPHHC